MPDTPTFGPFSSPSFKTGDATPSPTDLSEARARTLDSPKSFTPQFDPPSPSTNDDSPSRPPLELREQGSKPLVVVGSVPAELDTPATLPNMISLGRPVSGPEANSRGSKTPGPSGTVFYSAPGTPVPHTAPSKLTYVDRQISSTPAANQKSETFSKSDSFSTKGFDVAPVPPHPIDVELSPSSTRNSQAPPPPPQPPNMTSQSQPPSLSSQNYLGNQTPQRGPIRMTSQGRPVGSTSQSQPVEPITKVEFREMRYKRLLDCRCPLHLIKLRVLPRDSGRLLHESEEKCVLDLRKRLDATGDVDLSIFNFDCDRDIESRARLFLSRFLQYNDMDLELAASQVSETSRWLSEEGFGALSYNYISACLYNIGIKLITSTTLKIPNTPRLLVISGLARTFSSVMIRLVTAHWLFRIGCDTSISLEVDCAQTEEETIKGILFNIFTAFERLSLEPTEIILANLPKDPSIRAESVPEYLTQVPHVPQFWHKFMKYASVGKLTGSAAVEYSGFPAEVSVNELPTLKNIAPSHPTNDLDDPTAQIILNYAMTKMDWPIEKYRLNRLSYTALCAYKPIIRSDATQRDSALIGSAIASVETISAGTSVMGAVEHDRLGHQFEQWLRDLVIQEMTIPEKISSNTTFDEEKGSICVHANGLWETYIFGRDKAGRVNICINDLTMMNLQFINFLIIWTYRGLLRMPIGHSEQLNILINYHGLTLLNKRLPQLLQFLNTFYTSCVNKIYIFNTTFINRTVLQTAIKGSRQGGSVGTGGGSGAGSADSGRKLIPVIIVTEDIRSEISSQQRQYQFGIGKHRVKMSSSSSVNLPMAYFPSRV